MGYAFYSMIAENYPRNAHQNKISSYISVRYFATALKQNNKKG